MLDNRVPLAYRSKGVSSTVGVERAQRAQVRFIGKLGFERAVGGPPTSVDESHLMLDRQCAKFLVYSKLFFKRYPVSRSVVEEHAPRLNDRRNVAYRAALRHPSGEIVGVRQSAKRKGTRCRHFSEESRRSTTGYPPSRAG